MVDTDKPSRPITRPPAIADSICQLAVAPGSFIGIRCCELRACEQSLSHSIAEAAGDAPTEDDEDTLIDTCERVNCEIAAQPCELLELFNRMMKVSGVPDDGYVFERVD